MERKLELFEPSPYFAWAVHIDGLRERHDASVEREGVFDKAVAAIRAAKERGFRVTTNTTFFTHDTPQTVQQVLDFLNDELEVDQMMISPAYAYEKAPDQEHFLGVRQTRELFSAAFADGQAQDVAAQPHAAVPRLPRGQGGLPVHRLGNPELFGLRLAAALLPDGRRLREDLQGARRDDGVGEVRPRPRPALRQLHGALRVRAHGRPRDDEVVQAVAAGRVEPVAD
jgi:hopanoid biosynthesis associated radical SAM protein HpnH